MLQSLDIYQTPLITQDKLFVILSIKGTDRKINFLASCDGEDDYSDYSLFAIDLYNDNACVVDLWSIDEENPIILEYTPEDMMFYITFRDKQVISFILTPEERIYLVHGFQFIVKKFIELGLFSLEH